MTQPGQMITDDVFKLFVIVIIVLVARLTVLVIGPRGPQEPGECGRRTKTMPSAVEFSSLLFSYIIYVGSAILVLLAIIVSMFTSWTRCRRYRRVPEDNEPSIAVTVAIIVGIYFAIKLVETILEDVKFRSKKFNPQVVDLMESAIRYSLIIIGVLIVVFNLFSMIGMETVGILLVVVVLIFICLGIALSYTTIQNIVSGLALMDTSPFEVGDRIRIVGEHDVRCHREGPGLHQGQDPGRRDRGRPNNEIMHERIFNYSRAANHAINVFFEVSFEISHERVEAYVKEALTGVEGVLKEPKPDVRAVEIRGHNSHVRDRGLQQGRAEGPPGAVIDHHQGPGHLPDRGAQDLGGLTERTIQGVTGFGPARLVAGSPISTAQDDKK